MDRRTRASTGINRRCTTKPFHFEIEVALAEAEAEAEVGQAPAPAPSPSPRLVACDSCGEADDLPVISCAGFASGCPVKVHVLCGRRQELRTRYVCRACRDAGVLGCGKCRYAVIGCRTCRP